ncbi:hypothetical protein PVK06_020194 [Gossypium arboreum]|uniref:Uncharacterized protein n=1 Tax=Gossypium arboreum TaxID=29729 RepID=A0ABR0PM97_GOSAR|nr:hypothetical protein PVK06_020194 [Gossypium arboreum]
MDGPVITGLMIVFCKVDLCKATLGKVPNRWNHGPCYVRMPEELEDFKLLLDQRSKAKEGTRLHDRFVIDSRRRSNAYVYAIFRKIFQGTDTHLILHLYANVDVGLDVSACTAIDTDAHAVVNANVNTRDNADVPKIWGTLWLHADSSINTVCIIVLLGWLIEATTSRKSVGYTIRG